MHLQGGATAGSESLTPIEGGPRPIVWIIAYVAAGLVSAMPNPLSISSMGFSPLAVGTAMLARQGRDRWPVVLLASYLVSLIAFRGEALPSALIACVTTCECVLAATLLARWRFDPRFRRATDIPLLILVAGAIVPLVGATLATGSLLLVGRISAGALTATWLPWWAGDVARALAILPFLMLVDDRQPPESELSGPGRTWECALLAATAAVLGSLHAMSGREFSRLPYLPEFGLAVVPLMWAALRFNMLVTSGVMTVLAVAALFAFRLGGAWKWGESSVFASGLFELESRMVIAALGSLALSQAITAERRSRAKVTAMANALALRARHLTLALRAGRSGTWEWTPSTEEARWSDEVEWPFRGEAPRGRGRFRRWFSLVRPDFRTLVLDRVRNLTPAEPRFVLEVPMRLPDGSEGWHQIRAEFVDLGDRPRIVGTLTDVTERHRAVQDNERIAAIVSSSADAILSMDAAGHIRSWNAAAERMFGLGAREAIGRSFASIVPPELQEAEREHLARAFGGQHVPAFRAERITADGRRFVAQTSLSPVRDANGRVVEAAGICRDLTDQIELESQLIQSQKMEVVGRLAGGIAHDFNNLLTVIHGFAELASARVSKGDPVRESLDQISAAAEHAASLTQRLLAFSRRRAMTRVAVEVDAIVEQMGSILRRIIGEDIELVIRLGAAGRHVLVDSQQLEQALLNLVVNARDAAKAGGKIVVETRFVDGPTGDGPGAPSSSVPRVEIVVSDDGHGMDATTQARMFEPFFTTKEPGRGTGLGLSTVVAIVEDSSGQVRVTSAPGKGTSFQIVLPALESPVPSIPLPNLAEAHARSGETILLIEDDALVRAFVATCLERHGYTVLAFPGGEAALAVIHEHSGRVHLLLSDLVLPGGSGPAIAEDIMRCIGRLPTLWMSGHPDRESDVPGAPEDFLAKPFSVQQLLRSVRAAIDRPHRAADAAAIDSAPQTAREAAADVAEQGRDEEPQARQPSLPLDHGLV